MCDDIMHSVAGPCERLGEARLPNHRRLVVRDQHYPGMIEAPGHGVEGVVYGAISETGWRRLDDFEGDMYTRCQLEVTCRGRPMRVYSYLVKPEFHHRLDHRDWRLEDFLRHGKRAFVEAYIGYTRITDKS